MSMIIICVHYRSLYTSLAIDAGNTEHKALISWNEDAHWHNNNIPKHTLIHNNMDVIIRNWARVVFT